MPAVTPELADPQHNTHVTSGDTAQLRRYLTHRSTLQPAFNETWTALSRRFDEAQLNAWSVAVLELISVNAGATCLLTYWSFSKSDAALASLLEAASASAQICRHAGSKAASASLNACARIGPVLETGKAVSRWWRAMKLLAEQAPESCIAVADNTGAILHHRDVEAFDSFIATGLKFGSGDKRRRYSFFALEEDLARRLIGRTPDSICFPDVEKRTKAFVTALWPRPVLLASLPPSRDRTVRARASIAGPMIRLPDTYRGVQGDEAIALYSAAAAHAQAHLVYGHDRFAVGKLKPLQVALVTLIEDARVERLAMRDLPGLARSWRPFHNARPDGVDSPSLLARLSRALFDDAYRDDNGFVTKGRAMFAAAADRLHDPAISREIGMLLGNDLGQMRVQFNAKTYVIEPIYRDDGFGLWNFDDTASSSEAIELFTDAARIERQEDNSEGEPSQDEPPDGQPVSARPVPPDERGHLIAQYPEWDHVSHVEREAWTSVREITPVRGDGRALRTALDNADGLREKIRKLVRATKIGRSVRLNKQSDGHDIDLDAALDAGIALRAGLAPDARVFRSSSARHRDLAVVLLIDVSESTRDRIRSGASVLDLERLAVAALAEAIDALGDPFCLLTFASDGREDVRMTSVKTFAEPCHVCFDRLAGLAPGLSTRLGAALRHAGSVADQARAFRKLVIVLTDGEPSDIDVSEQVALVEDARHAAMTLHRRGIDTFGVVLGETGLAPASRIFGRGNTMPVRRLEDLPRRLSEVYFRLARR